MFRRLVFYVGANPKRAAAIILVLAVALILVLAGLAMALSGSDSAPPYPSSKDLRVMLVNNTIVFTQQITLGFQNESAGGNYPYTWMKIAFRAASGSTTYGPIIGDFGNQSMLDNGVQATVHQVLMNSTWINASVDITDMTGDGSFDEGDTIKFELIPFLEDTVFTVGLVWTAHEGGGAVTEFSFVVHDGKLYSWYSEFLGDQWYWQYLRG